MLSDKSFRRTLQCGKYARLIEEKDREPLIRPYAVEEMDGKVLTEEMLCKEGLEAPILIRASENSRKHLGLKLPSPDTTLSDIADSIGRDFPVKVIEVGAQHEIEGYTIGQYADYLANRSSMHKLLNMISLEVSATSLSTSILSPRVVRQVDWIDGFWPEDRRSKGDFPKVQKYVLAGMGDSYTDFHVDFGGTSVWYHILSGCKVFYLIPPTTENLRHYAAWIQSSSQDTTFFPETLSRLGECRRVKISAGDTLMIPSAWIHAVFTPEDSLVIGGNFLLSSSIVPQLQVCNVEQRTRVSAKYRFPYFRQLVWCVLCQSLPVEMKRQGFIDSLPSDLDMEESVLGHPRIGWSWPYLVKAAMVWCSEGMPPMDESKCGETADKCLQSVDPLPEELSTPSGLIPRHDNINSMMTVLNAWTNLLERLPQSLETSENKPAVAFEGYSQHLSHVFSFENSTKSFDVLNDDLFKFYPFVNKALSFYSDCMEKSAIKVEESSAECTGDEQTQAQAKTKLSIKFKRDMRPNSSADTDSTVASHGEKWGFSTDTTVTNSRSRASRSFGTRGKRLSTDFLRNASDFDIEEAVREDSDEEADMQEYHSRAGVGVIDELESSEEEGERRTKKPRSKVLHPNATQDFKPTHQVKKTVPRKQRGASSQLKARLKQKFSR